ncbi:MAG TPA: SH3 domain-containing protein [Accumulibacter sp.]|nr:SH3 domain-containing protein [Accumulibacter sp.]HMW16559.1 SH3 domain-containing protein [Accumulibacter sp.]HMX22597.1 SH3 domain-containing protein [Accumulibacter sp.]HMY06397.1 SH3 domain-containing protein [Accumulibacter sp.]HNC18177.1 SH3 domain-containing protein [Accumulibacter sp.]
MKRWGGLLLLMAVATPLLAVEYRSVDTPAVLYDAPSQKGGKLFVIRRGTPVEVVVALEGWVKVRDADGGLAWIESKFLGKKRTLIVTASRAQIRQSADETATVVFEAEKNVALDFVDTAPGGWLKVRHRDGQSGFVRLNQVWGA